MLVGISQKEQIKAILKDGEWHCHVLIHEALYIFDDRKRISELSKEWREIESLPCDGACGINHNSLIHRYRIKPVQPVQAGLFELRKLYDYETH